MGALVLQMGKTARKLGKLRASKALPVFRAACYFCAHSDLTLLNEAYDFSSQSEVSR